MSDFNNKTNNEDNRETASKFLGMIFGISEEKRKEWTEKAKNDYRSNKDEGKQMDKKAEYIDTRIKYCESEKAKEVLSSEIFDEMYDKRIFLIESYKSNFYIKEACDEYFDVKLTKEMCIELSKAFGELANLFETTTEEEKQ